MNALWILAWTVGWACPQFWKFQVTVPEKLQPFVCAEIREERGFPSHDAAVAKANAVGPYMRPTLRKWENFMSQDYKITWTATAAQESK